MQLHALLPDDSYRRLAVAAVPRHRVIRLHEAADLVRAASAGEVAACVIDPCSGRPGTIEALVAGVEAGDFPVLLYTLLNRSSVREILDLKRRSAADVLSCVHDEQPEYLRRAVDRLGLANAASLVLQELAPDFGRLPSQFGAECAGLFGGMSIPKSVSELFVRGDVKARTGNRWMNRVRLRSAECVLGCARLVLTWDGVCDPASNLAELAERAGIGGERALSDAYHYYCGLPPRRAGQQLATAEFAHRAALATRC
jgi:hypothetical protein